MITPVYRGDDVMAFPSPGFRLSMREAKASFPIHNNKTVPAKRT